MSSVFISYARQTGAVRARALRQALGARAFLDESEIGEGDAFPARVLDALLDSRVVVLFLDDVYLARRYCLWELRAALMPFTHAGDGALDHVVVALPPGEPPAGLGRLPRALRDANWPSADKTRDLAARVKARLAAPTSTLRERCVRAGLSPTRIRTDLLELVATPPPHSLGGLRVYPLDLPPSKDDRFVGRADHLWHVDHLLSPLGGGPEDAARVVALEGGGGCGKTQLALEYVHRFGRRRFKGGIFWLNAESPLEPQHHGVLRALRPATPDLAAFSRAMPPRSATAELREALHHASARARILFVVDNLPEPAPGQSPAPLVTWVPALGKVAILTTSRMKSGGGSVQPIPVETLGGAAAVQLLTHDLRPDLPPQTCADLVEWVGGLPLALSVLNAYLRPDPTLKLPELLARAKEGAGQAGALDSQADIAGSRGPDPLRGATEAYSYSFQNLSPEGQRAARLLAALGPDPVPVELVRELKISPGACDELLDRSFVSGCTCPEHTQGPVPMLGLMHRVLADVIRGLGPPGDAAAEVGRALQHVLYRAHVARNQWKIIAAVVPHAQHVLPHGGELRLELRACLFNVLSTCLAGLGRRREGAAASLESVDLCRRLERAHPGAFTAGLARALNNFSRRLASVGRIKDGLRASQESVALRRRLAEKDPEAGERNLASSLVQLSNRLGELGRRAPALEASHEAVDLYRRQVQPESEIQEWDLANALRAHSIRLSGVGRREEALRANQEALAVYRRLVARRSGAFEPELANALSDLSNHLGACGRPEEARAAGEEAVSLFRELVKARPGAFEPDLAMSLGSLSNWLRVLRWPEEALAATLESLREYRRLVRTQREAFEPAFALALNKLSVLLGDLGEKRKSISAVQAAIRIRRRLALERPEAQEPGLADSLLNLSIRQSELGLRMEALRAGDESVALYRRLAQTSRDRFEPDLANALGNLSLCLAAGGRGGEGLVAVRQSVAIYRRLAARQPRSFEADLAWALDALSIRLNERRRPDDALAAVDEAIALYRHLTAGSPAIFSTLLAGALENRRIIRRECGGPGKPAGPRKRAPARPRGRACRSGGPSSRGSSIRPPRWSSSTRQSDR